MQRRRKFSLITTAVAMRARSLDPLVKTRVLGMTLSEAPSIMLDYF